MDTPKNGHLRIWVDDIRAIPQDYQNENCLHFKSVEETLRGIVDLEQHGYCIEVIDLDHDAGQYARFGGDYIKILEWMEETGRRYPVRFHTMNPVGLKNMRLVIKNYPDWLEI